MVFLVLAIITLIASLAFNYIQYGWRQQDRRDHAAEKAERDKKELEREDERRRREEAPPEFYNIDGSSAPIRITGMAHALQEPLMDMSGNVTIVNPTNFPMKISMVRLVQDGNPCPVSRMFFREKDRMASFERISVRGNDKGDYELHIMFPDQNYPRRPARPGQLWVLSDNRAEPFSVEVTFP
jgi:hypothetical protein